MPDTRNIPDILMNRALRFTQGQINLSRMTQWWTFAPGVDQVVNSGEQMAYDYRGGSVTYWRKPPFNEWGKLVFGGIHAAKIHTIELGDEEIRTLDKDTVRSEVHLLEGQTYTIVAEKITKSTADQRSRLVNSLEESFNSRWGQSVGLFTEFGLKKSDLLEQISGHTSEEDSRVTQTIEHPADAPRTFTLVQETEHQMVTQNNRCRVYFDHSVSLLVPSLTVPLGNSAEEYVQGLKGLKGDEFGEFPFAGQGSYHPDGSRLDAGWISFGKQARLHPQPHFSFDDDSVVIEWTSEYPQTVTRTHAEAADV